MTDARREELMVKVADGVATPLEREELMADIAGDDELMRELEAHRALKATTDGWIERLKLDALEDAAVRSPVARAERAVGVSLVVGGTCVLGGFGLVELLLDPSAPLWVKLGTAAVLGGLALLLFSVVRWRLTTHAADKYKEVIR